MMILVWLFYMSSSYYEEIYLLEEDAELPEE